MKNLVEEYRNTRILHDFLKDKAIVMQTIDIRTDYDSCKTILPGTLLYASVKRNNHVCWRYLNGGEVCVEIGSSLDLKSIYVFDKDYIVDKFSWVPESYRGSCHTYSDRDNLVLKRIKDWGWL